VDIDRFVGERRATWDRLQSLVKRAERSVRRLDAAELSELVSLHQRVSAHLSYAQTYVADPDLRERLTDLVARSGAVVYGTRPRTTRSVVGFFAATFPGALWGIRRFVAVAAMAFVIPGAALAIWIANSDAALDATGPAAVRSAYVEEDFEAYYSSEPAAQFASEVFVNNARVGALAFAVGIGFALPTAFILALNGANLGVAAGLFAAVGEQGRFWGLILPHGLLEITAVCVAGGAGLALGWSIIDPGDLTRGQSLRAEARRSIVVVGGLVLVFLVAGLVEGFVTGSGLPTWGRVGVGVAVWTLFLTYVWTLGRPSNPRSGRGPLLPTTSARGQNEGG
jgi:uncharacterized membrane protein SpoIIM required for sporulation